MTSMNVFFQAARINLERDAETVGYSYATAAPGGAADVQLNDQDAELDFGEGRSHDNSSGVPCRTWLCTFQLYNDFSS